MILGGVTCWTQDTCTDRIWQHVVVSFAVSTGVCFHLDKARHHALTPARGCILATGYHLPRWRAIHSNESFSQGTYQKEVCQASLDFRVIRLIRVLLWPSRVTSCQLSTHVNGTKQFTFVALQDFLIGLILSIYDAQKSSFFAVSSLMIVYGEKSATRPAIPTVAATPKLPQCCSTHMRLRPIFSSHS